MPSQMTSVCLAAFLWLSLPTTLLGFSVAPQNAFSVGTPLRSRSTVLNLHEEDSTIKAAIGRRDALLLATASLLGGSLWPATANAEEEKTIYLTGKAPKVPGQKPKDKSDVSGTKKDPKFLRSISDCKNQCENTLGSDSLAKTKEDCLSECQDICCTTYEQCTFAIVPRI